MISIFSTLENDQALWSVSNTLIPFSKYTLSEYILHAKEDIHTAKQVRFVLSDQDQTPLGCIDLFDYDPIHRRAGVGVVIEKVARNKGFAKIALSLVEIMLLIVCNCINSMQAWKRIIILVSCCFNQWATSKQELKRIGIITIKLFTTNSYFKK